MHSLGLADNRVWQLEAVLNGMLLTLHASDLRELRLDESCHEKNEHQAMETLWLHTKRACVLPAS